MYYSYYTEADLKSDGRWRRLSVSAQSQQKLPPPFPPLKWSNLSSAQKFVIRINLKVETACRLPFSWRDPSAVNEWLISGREWVGPSVCAASTWVCYCVHDFISALHAYTPWEPFPALSAFETPTPLCHTCVLLLFSIFFNQKDDHRYHFTDMTCVAF